MGVSIELVFFLLIWALSGSRTNALRPSFVPRAALAKSAMKQAWRRWQPYLVFQKFDFLRKGRVKMNGNLMALRYAGFGYSLPWGMEQYGFEDESHFLSYVPTNCLREMPPKSKEMLARVTRRFVYGDTKGDPPINATEVLDAVNAEFKSYDLPVVIGNQTFGLRNTKNQSYRDMAKILSFAAMHQIPQEVTLLLFGEEDEELPRNEGKAAFAESGWKGVRFSRGVTIRLKRRLATSARERFFPISRAWLTNRNTRAAERMVQEASQVQPPIRQLISKEEFLASVDRELSSTRARSVESMIRKALLFFPRQRKTMKEARKTFIWVISESLRHLRTFLFVYIFLMCFWGTIGLSLVWRQQKTKIYFSMYTGYISSSLQQFAVALRTLASRSRLRRLILALLLIPLGEQAIRTGQDRLNLSTNMVVVVLGLFMLAFMVGMWTVLVFIDANVSRTIAM